MSNPQRGSEKQLQLVNVFYSANTLCADEKNQETFIIWSSILNYLYLEKFDYNFTHATKSHDSPSH